MNERSKFRPIMYDCLFKGLPFRVMELPNIEQMGIWREMKNLRLWEKTHIYLHLKYLFPQFVLNNGR